MVASEVFAVIVIMMVLQLIEAARFRYFKVSWRSLLASTLFSCFIVSVYNNHRYLQQKKQIMQMQVLKRPIPAGCLLFGAEKTSPFNWIDTFFTSSTSQQCIETAEAHLLTASQHNILESIAFTIAECSRHLGQAFGQFISAISNEISYFNLFLTIIVFFLVSYVFLLLDFKMSFFRGFTAYKHVSKIENECKENMKEKDELILFLLNFYLKNKEKPHCKSIKILSLYLFVFF